MNMNIQKRVGVTRDMYIVRYQGWTVVNSCLTTAITEAVSNAKLLPAKSI